MYPPREPIPLNRITSGWSAQAANAAHAANAGNAGNAGNSGNAEQKQQKQQKEQIWFILLHLLLLMLLLRVCFFCFRDSFRIRRSLNRLVGRMSFSCTAKHDSGFQFPRSTMAVRWNYEYNTYDKDEHLILTFPLKKLINTKTRFCSQNRVRPWATGRLQRRTCVH